MVRTEARLSALSGRPGDRAKVMHEAWARRNGYTRLWDQLTPEARAFWMHAATGAELAAPAQEAA